MKGINDIWDFVYLYYPKYHSCDTILAADYLSQLHDKSYQEDEDSGAYQMLIRDYGGDIDNPQIKADYDDCHRDIYERAIEGFIEALNERKIPPPGFHYVSGELLRLPDVEAATT